MASKRETSDQLAKKIATTNPKVDIGQLAKATAALEALEKQGVHPTGYGVASSYSHHKSAG